MKPIWYETWPSTPIATTGHTPAFANVIVGRTPRDRLSARWIAPSTATEIANRSALTVNGGIVARGTLMMAKLRPHISTTADRPTSGGSRFIQRSTGDEKVSRRT